MELAIRYYIKYVYVPIEVKIESLRLSCPLLISAADIN